MSADDELWADLRARVRQWSGNLLSVSSRAPALEALAERAARRRLTPRRYLDALERRADERQALLERLLIRTTWFMREPDAINGLAAVWRRRASGGSSRVTLWSVACASGEEPYSLAMAFLDAGLEPTVLGTDLSAEAREAASAGAYPSERLEELPARWRQRFFQRRADGLMEVTREVRSCVTILPLNLAVSTRPPSGWATFDVIVCRNVLLYFERHDAARILRELAEQTREDGFILLSAAEFPLAWSVRAFGWERSEDAPWLRRRRESSSSTLPILTPGAPGTGGVVWPLGRPDERTPPPTAAGLRELRRGLADAQQAARAGNTDLAIALARRLSSDHPLEAGCHLTLGLLLKGAGRLQEATSALRRARFLFGDDSWLAPYSLAVCLESTGDLREAVEAYRHARAILEWGGPSGRPEAAEEDEGMLAATALESCKDRLGRLRPPGGAP